jgi:outer membrane protein TolC
MTTPPDAPVLSLCDCRRIALEKQPTLGAYRAALAFARARAAAVEDLAVPDLVRPDLPTRRQQACLGVEVAAAQLAQAEWDTTYAVTRNYLTALYARDQYGVAERALNELERFKTVKGGANVVKGTWHEDKANVFVSLARGRRQEAVAGYFRAVAALREAMGVGPEFCFHLADHGLAYVGTPVCREQVIDLALARRGEVAMTSLTARIVGLEVDAQASLHHLSVPTFAANADIHAAPVPPNIRDGIYRPGGTAVEMPTTLSGCRNDRVNQARALEGRAGEVVEKTRKLITLEADDAYQRWAEGASQLSHFEDARKRAEKLGNQWESDIRAGGTETSVEDLFNIRLLARQNQLEYNTALYNYLVALADLERITAGGFCAGFEAVFCPQGLPTPASPPAPPAPGDANNHP